MTASSIVRHRDGYAVRVAFDGPSAPSMAARGPTWSSWTERQAWTASRLPDACAKPAPSQS